jgi:multiple sugar transport system ATP-binding protein
MAGIRFEQVSKDYAGHKVIEPFSLEIKDGEFFVLVGPSGCGKTTMLRMLAGLEETSGGSIWMDGADITHLEPKDRDIAMVFQNYALYPHMNVYNNMAYALKLRGYSKERIQDAVEKAAVMLDMEKLLKRYPRELSGGQQQRVALGRAIVRQPKVFLMDEPLSNLDARLRVQMRAELIRLHAELKATIVYVTHDQVEAMTMGSRIMLMHNGAIQQVGAPMELYGEPANRFVGGFIGSPPMQFLQGSLSWEDGRGVFRNETIKLFLAGDCSFQGEVCLGLRPEHLSLAKEGDANTIQGTVEIVENIGSEAIVHFSVGEAPLAIKIPTPRSLPKNGESISVMPGNLPVHVFNLETGRYIAKLRSEG